MSKHQFWFSKEKGFEEEGFENMEETNIRTLEQQALGPFRQSFTKRYEQWKMGGLLPIALQTMPKQVKSGEVLYRLVQLRCERERNLNEET
jgi:hypothetical protein